MKIKNLPNYITCLRILGTLFLFFTESLSVAFFVTYLFTGVTDALDGWLARKMNVVSEFGAKLDSIADLLFYTVLLAKIFPKLWETLPYTIWIVLAAVLLVRCVAYVVAFVKYRRFASIHTYMNKMTGFAIFAYPCFLLSPVAVPVAFAVCTIGGMASFEELLIHIFRSGYNGDAKTILLMK